MNPMGGGFVGPDPSMNNTPDMGNVPEMNTNSENTPTMNTDPITDNNMGNNPNIQILLSNEKNHINMAST